MAQTTNAFFSGQASGSVDSLTGAYNTTGQYIRTRIKGVKKRSNFRTFVSNNKFLQSRYLWANLDSATRLEWTHYTANLSMQNALGQTFRPKPEVIFYRHCQTTLQYFGLQPISVPSHGSINYLPRLDTGRDADGIYLTWDETIPSNAGIAVFTWRNLLTSQFHWSKKKLAYFFDVTYNSPQYICSAVGADSDLDFLPYAVEGLYTFFWVKTVDRYGRSSPFVHFQTENSP